MSTNQVGISLPSDFRFDEVPPGPRTTGTVSTPPLGVLASFTGTWQGSGFNTIFRPDNPISASAEKLPHPLPAIDNLLELNLTSEELAFSPALGNVPNRGEIQEDVFINGVPYVQSVKDVTSGAPVAIHLEPGLWMAVPATKQPAEGETLVRMASIPHGTTICAQGSSQFFGGAPVIAPAEITPFVAGDPAQKIHFPSQEAANGLTQRIPQDLTPFIAAGTITQEILNDPNSVLRKHNSGQTILDTWTISISTAPAAPLFGGGTDNIAFLLGHAAALTNPNAAGQNAQSVQLSATFWLETVEHIVEVPPFRPGQPPLKLKPQGVEPGAPAPTFLVRPPMEVIEPFPIPVIAPQLQYSQTVLLNFNGLSWPHVSVATLAPSAAQPVPPSVWEAHKERLVAPAV